MGLGPEDICLCMAYLEDGILGLGPDETCLCVVYPMGGML